MLFKQPELLLPNGALFLLTVLLTQTAACDVLAGQMPVQSAKGQLSCTADCLTQLLQQGVP